METATLKDFQYYLLKKAFSENIEKRDLILEFIDKVLLIEIKRSQSDKPSSLEVEREQEYQISDLKIKRKIITKMAERRVYILVEGKVQGVFFRATARDVARSLGVKGWVRNRWDRKVELVIEGDIETSLDAEKMSSLNVETFQINTGPFGGDCHLEASWVKSAVDSMSLKGVDLVFIENIGNLVCPAEFDTGAHINVVILSTPEGEDKPLKYPLMFRKSDVLVISKMDLVPHLNVNVETIIKNARGINPEILVFPLSTKTNEGVDKWVEYLRRV